MIRRKLSHQNADVFANVMFFCKTSQKRCFFHCARGLLLIRFTVCMSQSRQRLSKRTGRGCSLLRCFRFSRNRGRGWRKKRWRQVGRPFGGRGWGVLSSGHRCCVGCSPSAKKGREMFSVLTLLTNLRHRQTPSGNEQNENNNPTSVSVNRRNSRGCSCSYKNRMSIGRFGPS